MKEDEFGKMMGELGSFTAEPVRPTLADDIKAHIPSKLESHHKGMHTVNIIIDLRVSRLAAAGVVVITLVLLAGLLGDRNSASDGILEDARFVIGLLRGTDAKNSQVTAEKMREHLVDKGEDVVFYPNAGDRQDSNSIRMHWKLPNGRYKVVFSDYREKEVSAEELIKLLARMLQQQK